MIPLYFAGRRDGRVSNASEVLLNLPSPFFNVSEQKEFFARKGLSLEEMVTLSGAHTVGITRCELVVLRLTDRNFSRVNGFQPPPVCPRLAADMRRSCPNDSSRLSMPLDLWTPNRFDSAYFDDLIAGRGVLISDQVLYDEDPATRRMVVRNARYGELWMDEFAKAMVRLGGVDVLTGDDGEIRKNCRAVNTPAGYY